jgi:hypothetical protein
MQLLRDSVKIEMTMRGEAPPAAMKSPGQVDLTGA